MVGSSIDVEMKDVAGLDILTKELVSLFHSQIDTSRDSQFLMPVT